MKTIRLYDESPYLKTCESIVKSQSELGYIFDQSIFFPEKGGQKCDRGFIDGIEVVDVQEIDGQLIHQLKSPLTQERVTMTLDYKFRFDQMQQHCGEHILSGLIKKIYQGNNHGFHIGKEEVTLDIDILLSEDMMIELEDEVNQVIVANLPVSISSLDVYDERKLRKPSSVDLDDLNEVRVVYIDGVDAVTCCGTHPKSTGEIGLLKLLKIEKNKSYYRITFKCGLRALKDYQKKSKILTTLHTSNNSNDENLLELMAQKDLNVKTLKGDYNLLNHIYAREVGNYQWDGKAKEQFIYFEHLDKKVFNDWLKSAELKSLDFLCVYVASLKQLVLCHDGQSDFSCSDEIKNIESYGGKGGGTHKRAQGKFASNEKGLSYFNLLKESNKKT